jgi:hypothetical protein
VADSPKSLGKQLLELGCRQGAITQSIVPVLWSRRSGDDAWEPASEMIPASQLVIASQDCDIAASEKAEPFVEALTVSLVTDRGEIHNARKGNSSRRFLLRFLKDKAALIATGTHRVLIEKRSLLGATFSPALDPDDRSSRRRFADWLGDRYRRAAIPLEWIEAAHEPLVQAIEKVRRSDSEMNRRLIAVDEILLRIPKEGTGPSVAEFILLTDEEGLGAEDEAELSGWIEKTILDAEVIREVLVSHRTSSTISLADYMEMTRLDLDHYSKE